MLSIFRSLSVYFLKNVCFIILNFLYFNFKRYWLFAVCLGLHIHEWALRIHGSMCGRPEVDFECPPQLLLQLTFYPHTMYFPEPRASHFGYIGWPASPPEFCFFLPLTTSLELQMYTVKSGFYVDVRPHSCAVSP